MKIFRFLMALAGLASAQLAAAGSQAPLTDASTTGSFARTSGLNFGIDGKTGYFAGSNAYWIGYLTDDNDVDQVFAHLQEAGLKILRVWGFNDVNEKPEEGRIWYQLHRNRRSYINTGADGLQRLDSVVSSAAKYGVKLIINFVNHWDDYGGMNAYLNAYGGSWKSDFYTHEDIQTAYRTYIKAVVTRYRDSAAIFAWELANEPRCKGCNSTVINNWAEETSRYIKSLDARHMIGIGDEGFGLWTGSDDSYPYQFAEGTNFGNNLAIPTIDFGTFHLYPDQWDLYSLWGKDWVSSHEAVCRAAGKPCILEEYGSNYSRCSTEKPWQQTALDEEGVAADLFWQWGDKLSAGRSPNDGYTIYMDSEDFQCLVTDHVAAIGELNIPPL
ncbi:glycoside hydrolase 5 family protein [Aspergillus melleus]|uniref:glycoside hydrolase 5 family protein n=1 Tax=Aspergillus melleus TaxID=138277 RepID=UPI001E8CB72B|nr:mannan endo-1,4-beta-mannosidase A-1 [Aspergillus melleus]KAH8426919.1 mannan endo-1,4-beta-mannosidase A-1 [Aspergillus melleus]